MMFIKISIIIQIMKFTCSLLDFLVNGEVLTAKVPGGGGEIVGTTLVTGGSGDLQYF